MRIWFLSNYLIKYFAMFHIPHVVFLAIFKGIKKIFGPLFSIPVRTRSISKKKMHKSLTSRAKAKIFGIFWIKFIFYSWQNSFRILKKTLHWIKFTCRFFKINPAQLLHSRNRIQSYFIVHFFNVSSILILLPGGGDARSLRFPNKMERKTTHRITFKLSNKRSTRLLERSCAIDVQGSF